MASRILPGAALEGFWDLGEDGWKTGMDTNLLKVSSLLQGRALDLVAALPGSPTDGDIYLLDETAGADANKIAVRDNGAWVLLVPQTGWQMYDVTLGALRTFNGTVWAEPAASGGYSGGVISLPVLAAAMTARTTNGAASGTTETTTNKVMLPTLDFDSAADEFAQFLFPMPKSWNEGTVTAQFIWTAASGSGDVVWGIQAVAISEADPLDAAFGAAQTVTDTLTTALDNHTTSFTGAVTIGGTPAEGDLVCFQVYRDADAAGDTLAVDAKLVAIRLNFTTNAADDS